MRGISRVYGRTRALNGVNLQLWAGELVALLGPNGAGKSTLVSILATLTAPSQGSVTFDGELDGESLRQRIGVIAHESFCYGDLSGRENLAFFAKLYQVANSSTAIAELLARVGLSAEAADRPFRTYSRGMAQRLSIARALLPRPQLLLADEPFTGLDRSGIEALQRLFSEERRRGATLLVVTHDFAAVAALVDRVLVLKRGRLVHDAVLAERSATSLAAIYQQACGEAP